MSVSSTSGNFSFPSSINLSNTAPLSLPSEPGFGGDNDPLLNNGTAYTLADFNGASAMVNGALPTTGQSHEVKAGENLTRIAMQRLGKTHEDAEVHAYMREIAQANKVSDPNKLKVGQQLQLPPTQKELSDSLDSQLGAGLDDVLGGGLTANALDDDANMLDASDYQALSRPSDNELATGESDAVRVKLDDMKDKSYFLSVNGYRNDMVTALSNARTSGDLTAIADASHEGHQTKKYEGELRNIASMPAGAQRDALVSNLISRMQADE